MGPSGHAKRQKKEHIENFIRSQKGSMAKFIVKETHEKKIDEINIGDSCNVNIGESSSHGKKTIT